MNDLGEELQRCLRGRLCFVGIGNVDWADDGFGVRLAEALQADINVTKSAVAENQTTVLIVHTTPEAWVDKIKALGVDQVILLDAVDLGAEPGAVAFLGAREIKAHFPQISTHKISLSLLASLIESSGGPIVWLMGVQPQSLKPAPNLSEPVQTALCNLRELFLNLPRLETAAADSNLLLHLKYD